MMHTKILEKCLEELRKDAPRKDYVIGMLETLVEMDGGTLPSTGTYYYPTGPSSTKADSLVLTRTMMDEVISNEDKEYARKMADGPVGGFN